MEALIVLPAFLLLSSLIIQLALIAGARMLLHYAAFSAARCLVVASEATEEARASAERILCLAPGARRRAGRQQLEMETVTAGEGETDPAGRLLQVRLSWRYPLVVPLAGRLLGGRNRLSGFPVLKLDALWCLPREEDPAAEGDKRHADGKG